MQTVASFLMLYLHMKLLHIDLLQRFAVQMPNGQDTLKTFFTFWCFSLLWDHRAMHGPQPQSQALFRENATQDIGSSFRCSVNQTHFMDLLTHSNAFLPEQTQRRNVHMFQMVSEQIKFITKVENQSTPSTRIDVNLKTHEILL